jgi:ATP phosphoribosyltransferase regulatory subunit HisZ
MLNMAVYFELLEDWQLLLNAVSINYSFSRTSFGVNSTWNNRLFSFLAELNQLTGIDTVPSSPPKMSLAFS